MDKRNKTTVEVLTNRFLLAQKRVLAKSSYAVYRGYCRKFAIKHGRLYWYQVTATTVLDWVDDSYGDQSGAAQFNAARSISRMFRWADNERIIPAYPLKGLRKPQSSKRELTISYRQYATILNAAKSKSILFAVKFLWHTGCRPTELRKVRAEWVKGRKIIMPVLDSKGRRKNRVIYLNDAAARLVARLPQSGHLFRSPTGKPWTSAMLNDSFRRLRKRAGMPWAVPYLFRHSFITRLLERGVDVATVAALAGNTPQTIFKHYSHVEKNEDRLLAVLKS